MRNDYEERDRAELDALLACPHGNCFCCCPICSEDAPERWEVDNAGEALA